MGHFNKFGGGGDRGNRKFGGPPQRGSFAGGPRQMHPATCSKCGQSCEVPFKPTGDRPVFCINCFKSQGSGGRGAFAPKSIGSSNNNRPSADNGGGAITSAQFDALNVKLDKILTLLSPAKIEKKIKKAPAKKAKTAKTKKK